MFAVSVGLTCVQSSRCAAAGVAVVLSDLSEEAEGLLQVLLQEHVVFVVVAEGSGQISDQRNVFLRVLHPDPGARPSPRHMSIQTRAVSAEARITAGWTEPITLQQQQQAARARACVCQCINTHLNTHSLSPSHTHTASSR